MENSPSAILAPEVDAEEPVELTVVIPAFNEEGAIAEEIDGLHAVLAPLARTYEIIVVDDGSSDATAERAEATECRLIRQPFNRGYGAALKRGIREARSELVVITDADGTYPAEDIPRLLEEAEAYDMVVGARTGSDVHVSWMRWPAKLTLRVLASYLAGVRIPDLNSGLRVMRRSHVMQYARILPNAFSFTTTITLSLLCNDYTVKYVPINYRKRVGASKIRPTDAWRFLMLILRTMVLFNPLKVFIPLGAVLFLGGLAKFIYDLFIGDFSETAVTGLLGGVVVWSLGLLADQNSRLGLDRNSWDSPDRR